MTSQTGVSDFVPSATDDALLWLHAIELEAGAEPVELQLEPLAEGRPGSDVIVAAVTLFRGSGNPLARLPRFQVRVDGLGRASARGRPRDGHPDPPAPAAARPAMRARTGSSAGGRPRADPAAPARGGQHRRPGDGAGRRDRPRRLDRRRAGPARRDVRCADPAGRRSIEVLPAPRVPVEVEIVDGATGERVPGRVRFIAADGRYLPPVGHRDEVNPGNYEDTGADLVLGSAAYAYVPGRFAIELPVGAVDVEVVGGFDRAPHRARLEIDPSTRRLELPLDRTIDLHAGRWVTADTPRPLPLAVDRAPPGGGRGRRPGQPARRPNGATCTRT